ncbi:hypothetical protein EVAR_7953_1 [Eumeta japonica]|uniref:Uncharacterized protein n=1 Tax=Eumeta variegata TaxID=151549 RepID=A0A4C1THW7_EUMVA|nr:hypothetical protein EVAR_7953_1 [Eumeta japonica]
MRRRKLVIPYSLPRDRQRIGDSWWSRVSTHGGDHLFCDGLSAPLSLNYVTKKGKKVSQTATRNWTSQRGATFRLVDRRTGRRRGPSFNEDGPTANFDFALEFEHDTFWFVGNALDYAAISAQ